MDGLAVEVKHTSGTLDVGETRLVVWIPPRKHLSNFLDSEGVSRLQPWNFGRTMNRVPTRI